VNPHNAMPSSASALVAGGFTEMAAPVYHACMQPAHSSWRAGLLVQQGTLDEQYCYYTSVVSAPTWAIDVVLLPVATVTADCSDSDWFEIAQWLLFLTSRPICCPNPQAHHKQLPCICGTPQLKLLLQPIVLLPAGRFPAVVTVPRRHL